MLCINEIQQVIKILKSLWEYTYVFLWYGVELDKKKIVVLIISKHFIIILKDGKGCVTYDEFFIEINSFELNEDKLGTLKNY